MNNRQVAHLWANEAKPHARGSNFFFDGPAIYSYGSHFCVGRIVRNKKKKRAYLLNSDTYSSSTGRHQNITRRAIAQGEAIFYVSGAHEDHERNRGGFKRQIAYAMKQIPSRRTADNIRWDFGQACDAASAFNTYSDFFQLRGRIKLPKLPAADSARMRRYTISKEKRIEKHRVEWEAGEPERARLQALRDQEAAIRDAQRRQEFRDGAPRSSWSYVGGPCMLRLNGDTFETSQGADVPRAEGEAMGRFIARCLRDPACLPYSPGSNPPTAGGFTLREITREHVRVGCHTIPLTEWAAMAALVGIDWPVNV